MMDGHEMQPSDYAAMLLPYIDRLIDFKPKLAARMLIMAANNDQLMRFEAPAEELPLVWITLREIGTQRISKMTVGLEALDRYLAKIDSGTWEVVDIDRG